MIAYHGCSFWNARKLAQAISTNKIHFPGIFVTDTKEHAARYANAQVSGTVDPNATALKPDAAIVTLEIPDDTEWLHRPENHRTLDVCEACVQTARVVNIEIHECDYLFCECHPYANLREMSAPQAAARIGISEQRIRKLCAEHRLGRKVGNRWIIGQEELLKLARELRKDSRSPLHK